MLNQIFKIHLSIKRAPFRGVESNTFETVKLKITQITESNNYKQKLQLVHQCCFKANLIYINLQTP